MTTVATFLTSRVAEYADAVRDGRIICNKWVRLAVDRWFRDLETGHERQLEFDAEEAQFAIDFVECLRHSKGKQWAGQPLKLQPWQCFIVANIFGWLRYDWRMKVKRRRFNTAFVSVARKNGKSTLGAAVGHKMFVADNEPGAEVYSAATKRDQAKIVHEEAKRMVRSSPSLKKLVTVLRDNLHIEETNSKYEPLGADADTLDGLNISCAIIDEIHAQRTRELWDVLETSTGARQDPLLFAITTAGDAGDTESIYSELKSYTCKILEGAAEDDSWFGFIASLDDGDDWGDPDVWIKANPNFGVCVDPGDLERKALKAKGQPSAVANFRRRHCNEDVESLTPWVTMEAWKACGPGDCYDEQGLTEAAIRRFRGWPCWVGGDLSSVSDLTALVFAFPGDDGVDVLPFAWCPRDNAVGRARHKRAPYLSWAARGRLELTEGDSVDYDALRGLLRRARDDWKWDIRRIHLDPNNARYLITKMIEEDGWRPTQVVEQLQTTGHMNESIGLTEKQILDQRLRHSGHEALKWCVSNVVIYEDTGGRRRFDKKRSTEKIDLAVAMAMAVGAALTDTSKASPYSRRGFLTL